MVTHKHIHQKTAITLPPTRGVARFNEYVGHTMGTQNYVYLLYVCLFSHFVEQLLLVNN